jgi:hypothetical protein
LHVDFASIDEFGRTDRGRKMSTHLANDGAGSNGDFMQVSFSKATTYLLTALLGMSLSCVNQQSFAQDVNASLSGEVTDPAGAVIPGAKVTLIHETSGARQDFQTDASGEYNFRNLPPESMTFL